MTIPVKKQDVLPFVYFVGSMAQQSKNGMYAFTGKRDLIGGIFDRFINIIPESLSFNKYFIPKAQQEIGDTRKVEVCSDFYIYDPKKVGIAPDVFGLKIEDKVIPFVQYDDTQASKHYWVKQDHCPQIEVKSFFGKKNMVSLRDQGYGDKYLVMVNADIDTDYLVSFFNSSILDETQFAKLEMPDDDFIVSNEKGLLGKPASLDFSKEELGNIEILCVTTAQEFNKMALKLSKGEKPRYLKAIKPRARQIKEDDKRKHSLGYYCDKQPSGLYRFNSRWDKMFASKKSPKAKTLDIYVENPDALTVINSTQNGVTVLAKKDTTIKWTNKEEDDQTNQPQDNDFNLEKGKQYNLVFATMETATENEYFLNIDLVKELPNFEDDMIKDFAEIIQNN